MTDALPGTALELDPSQLLADLETDHVYFCPNPGNAGDSAIAVGAYHVFRSAGVEWTDVAWNEEFDSSGKTVIYGGGGNLAAAYPQARTFIEQHHERADRFVLLPHTIQGNGKLLSALGSNVVLFCREMRSFEHADSVATGARVHLWHDLALQIDVDDLLERAPATSRLLTRMTLRSLGALGGRLSGGDSRIHGVSVRSAVIEAARAAGRLGSSDSRRLFALRRDREAFGGPPPRANVDVSAVFAYGVSPADTALDATTNLLAYLNRFDRITTNRLHVCILGAMLGKQIDFHANSYFKNEAVYRFSLGQQFPNVRWCGEWTP
ncbi:MAG: hypothetical protein HKN17_01755 [Rhodothermales bacterium]|nr:hypothetical protein [Rhodothermales bacterium]